MSEPRHAMIYRDAIHKKWWLEIVVNDIQNQCDTLSESAETFGPFGTIKKARDYADENFQNTGFEIPVLDPKVFEYMSPPPIRSGADDRKEDK
jgi:hypothetical protein